VWLELVIALAAPAWILWAIVRYDMLVPMMAPEPSYEARLLVAVAGSCSLSQVPGGRSG
jgi:hypothetical protein